MALLVKLGLNLLTGSIYSVQPELLALHKPTDSLGIGIALPAPP